MKTPKWICSKCRQPFTRKWNANRHCNNKHSGRIENIISFTDYIVNRTDSSIPLSRSYKDNNNNHLQLNHQELNVKKHLFLDKSISVNNNLAFNTIDDPVEDLLERELLPHKVLEPVCPIYEEMQSLLDSFPEPYRQIFLKNALISAINSGNPVETMHKKLTEYRKFKTSRMMLNDLASYYGQDKEYIKEWLRLKFKQNDYRQFSK